MGSLQGAFRHLRRKAFRSIMTMSGIVIGVALVALVSIIGAAGEAAVSEELESMGLGGLSVTATDTTALERQALETVRAMPQVASAVPLMVEMASLTLRDGTAQDLVLCGIDSGEVQAIGLKQRYGRMLTKADIDSEARVCVVDGAVAQALYSRENIVGATVVLPIGGVQEPFTVVGVTQAGSAILQNVTRLIPGMVYIPYTTMQQLDGRTAFDQLAVQLVQGVDEDREAAHIEQVLGRIGGEGVYSADNLAAQRDKLAGVMDVVTLVLTAISAVSLLVSGLSIMTVMTVSVGERTREIGIKKALGATNGRILRDFLSEALLLSVGGGAIGVAVGVLFGAAGLAVFGMEIPLWQTTLWLIGFAAVVGVIFGVYPALKAAKMDPVEALRCE